MEIVFFNNKKKGKNLNCFFFRQILQIGKNQFQIQKIIARKINLVNYIEAKNFKISIWNNSLKITNQLTINFQIIKVITDSSQNS